MKGVVTEVMQVEDVFVIPAESRKLFNLYLQEAIFVVQTTTSSRNVKEVAEREEKKGAFTRALSRMETLLATRRLTRT